VLAGGPGGLRVVVANLTPAAIVIDPEPGLEVAWLPERRE
jgi:hypothetical protein